MSRRRPGVFLEPAEARLAARAVRIAAGDDAWGLSDVGDPARRDDTLAALRSIARRLENPS